MKKITPEEVKQRLDKGEKLNLVDVREIHERDEFNIGGIHIPFCQFQIMQIDQLESLINDEVILYCQKGNRSWQSALILDTMGFTNAKSLSGGISDWIEKFGNAVA